MEKILPKETQDPEKEPQGIGAATEPPEGKPVEEAKPKGIKIAKDSWNADEIAMVLGLRKSFDDKTGQIEYGVARECLLTTLVMNLIAGHEQFKRQRIGLKTIGGAILNPFGPGNGNGPG